MPNGVELGVLVLGELAKAYIMFAFQAARNAGLTPEQIDALFASEKAKFLANDPAKLPHG